MRMTAAIIVLMFAGWTASARLGETAEQAEQRYGKGEIKTGLTDIFVGGPAPEGCVKRVYSKNGISIGATFFPNKAGKMVVGYLYFAFPNAVAAAAAFPDLLKSNAGGEEWRQVAGGYVREGATASLIGYLTTFKLKEYDAYVAAVNAKRKASMQEQAKGSIKGF